MAAPTVSPGSIRPWCSTSRPEGWTAPRPPAPRSPCRPYGWTPGRYWNATPRTSPRTTGRKWGRPNGRCCAPAVRSNSRTPGIDGLRAGRPRIFGDHDGDAAQPGNTLKEVAAEVIAVARRAALSKRRPVQAHPDRPEHHLRYRFLQQMMTYAGLQKGIRGGVCRYGGFLRQLLSPLRRYDRPGTPRPGTRPGGDVL